MLVSSYWFCLSAGVKCTAALLLITVVSYTSAIALERTDSIKHRKLILVISIIVCCSGLFAFKYLNFFFNTVAELLSIFTIHLSPLTLKLVLPIGISYYTFSTISYIIDVYKGRIAAEHNFGIYAAFVAFFPKLIAGPIERAEDLIPQLKQEKCFDCQQGVSGLKLILWGGFKKLVIADTLIIYVDPVFGNISQYSGFALILAAFFFTIQIYCDFSGYSDIAMGTAKLFGFDLMVNFKAPYFSCSVKEFWRRWHISLSSWFRDYVYIPLGGSRVAKPREYFNLMVTFLCSGLWHGANWTFIFWGGLHGLAQAIEKMLRIKSPKKRGGITWWLRCTVVFVFAGCAWVFFRADSFGDAVYLFVHMFDGIGSFSAYLFNGFNDICMTKGSLVTCIVFLIPLVIYDYVSARYDCDAGEILAKKSSAIQWIVYVAIGCFVVFLSQKGVAAEFVYMQF